MRFPGLTTLMVFASVSCFSAPVTPSKSPDWHEAPAEQRALLPKTPNVSLVDFSYSEALRGYGLLMYSQGLEPMSRQVLDETVDSYLKNVMSAGQSLVAQREAVYEGREGRWIMTEAKVPAGELHHVTLILCGENDILTFTMGHVGDTIDEHSDLVASYLKRFKLDPVFKPGDIHRDRATVKLLHFGALALRTLAWVAAAGLALALVFFLRRKFAEGRSAA